MPYISSKQNIDWYYDFYGEGPEAVVFLHGWAADRRVWNQQIEFFSKNFKVIIIDLPGHGRSSWQETTLDDMANDLFFILSTLGIRKPNIVGSSMGGMVALKYLDLYPNKVNRVVLVGALPTFAKSKEFPHGLAIPRIRKLKEQVEKDFPHILNVFFRSLFTIKERKSVRFKWLQMFQKNNQFLPDQQALLKLLLLLEKEDLSHVLEGIRVLVLLTSGVEDYICTREANQYLHSKIANSSLRLFDDCGHFPFLTKPKEFNQMVEEFLNDNND